MSKTFLYKMLGLKRKTKVSKEEITCATLDDLNTLEERLRKKIDFLEVKVQEQFLAARNYGLANRSGAKRALRKKRRLEKELVKMNEILTSIEIQRETIESAKINTEILNTLADGATTLKLVNDNLDMDKIHEIMDTILEQCEVGQELNNVFTFGVDNSVDEAELDEELRQIAKEDEERRMKSQMVGEEENNSNNDDKAKSMAADIGSPGTTGTTDITASSSGSRSITTALLPITPAAFAEGSTQSKEEIKTFEKLSDWGTPSAAPALEETTTTKEVAT